MSQLPPQDITMYDIETLKGLLNYSKDYNGDEVRKVIAKLEQQYRDAFHYNLVDHA